MIRFLHADLSPFEAPLAFYLVLALLPLGAYLLVLGLLRLSGRPLVTTGSRDLIALACGVSGLVAVGPGELFFPASAGVSYGMAVWPMLAFLYYLLVSMVVLNNRPRLVVYGFDERTILPLLAEACRQLDPASEVDASAGTVGLPGQQVHLRVIAHKGGQSCDIEAFESNVPPQFWRLLMRVLRATVAPHPAAGRQAGAMLTAAGLAMLAVAAGQLLVQPGQLAAELSDWLHR